MRRSDYSPSEFVVFLSLFIISLTLGGKHVIGMFVSLVIFLFVGLNRYDRMKDWLKKRREKRRAREMCQHGVIGSLVDPRLCLTCYEEQTRANENVAPRQAEQIRHDIELTRKAVLIGQRNQSEEEKNRHVRSFLKVMDPRDFEQFVCELYTRIGYNVRRTQYCADNGIDGFLEREGRVSILQCKRVKGYVGEPVIRDLYGTLVAQKAVLGIVVTTGRVSNPARLWAEGKPIEFVELDKLVKMVRREFPEYDTSVPKSTVEELEKLSKRGESSLFD